MDFYVFPENPDEDEPVEDGAVKANRMIVSRFADCISFFAITHPEWTFDKVALMAQQTLWAYLTKEWRMNIAN